MRRKQAKKSICEQCNIPFDYREDFELSEEEAQEDEGKDFVCLCGECYDVGSGADLMSRTRIYVAGPYQSDNFSEILNNIRQGISSCASLIANGYSAFCPWLDYQYGLSKVGPFLKVADYQENSQAWLEVADAVLVLPGWENSEGTKTELKRAERLKIPVYYTLHDLVKEVSLC